MIAEPGSDRHEHLGLPLAKGADRDQRWPILKWFHGRDTETLRAILGSNLRPNVFFCYLGQRHGLALPKPGGVLEDIEHSLNGKHQPAVTKVVIIGTFTPRECGIATFSADVMRSLQDLRPEMTLAVVALNDGDDYRYDERVLCEIREQVVADYVEAAQAINRGGFDVVSVQHEYGIFGGKSGAYLLELVRDLDMPVVTTLHTVLQEPSADQRAVLDELLQLSERVVVMSERAKRLLVQVHGLSDGKIDLIHHGVPRVAPRVPPESVGGPKAEGPILLTFGLLSPDKGIEFVIQAMPEMLAHHPDITYFVVGATHPHQRSHAGEAYREKLKTLADELGISQQIRFVDRFVTKEELNDYLSRMDIYITPYLTAQQITSGTLAYAVGSGKAVISTPYPYAQELLADGRGLLVPFRDSGAIAESIRQLLDDRPETLRMGARAAEFGKQMQWPEVGRRYLESFARARQNARSYLRAIRPMGGTHLRAMRDEKPPSLRHLMVMTDDTGLIQHANFAVPNRSEGYCVDDNARALLLTVQMERLGSLSAEASAWQSRFLSFVQDAWNPAKSRFRNFLGYNREWLEESGSTDSQGRTIWALGAVMGSCADSGRRQVATHLFEQSFSHMRGTTSPRTAAYALLGFCEAFASETPSSESQAVAEELAGWLYAQGEVFQQDDWPWFENSLAYANARLPQALIYAGKVLGRPEFTKMGLRSLEWLMDVQSGEEGKIFVPIGTDGFYTRGGERRLFDQQPIEAWSSLSACLSAFRTTGQPVWLDHAHRCIRWFLGKNTLGVSLINPVNGSCFDGLHPDRVNQNQGAESTLAYLCAWYELQLALIPAESHTDRSVPNERI